MCGRYSLSAPTSQIIEQFEIEEEIREFEEEYRPRYNIAPGQKIPVIRKLNQRKKIDFLKWQFIPSWTKDIKKIPYMINARAETVSSKPSFRSAFRRKRCIVPASCFYEWKKIDKSKQPMLIREKDGSLMGIAGLWELWQDEKSNNVETTLLITTIPNTPMMQIHDRMPVILEKKDYDKWLDCSEDESRPFDKQVLESLLVPVEDKRLEIYPISTLINSAKIDDPQCIQRI